MIIRSWCWGCVLLCGLTASLRLCVSSEASQEKPTVKNQTGEPAPPAHPAELRTFVERAQLFHACAEALARAKHVTYDIRAEVKKLDRTWKLTGQVWVAPSPTPFDAAKLKHAFDIKIEEGGRITGYQGAWDGKTLRSSKEGESEIIVTDFDNPPPRMAFPYEVLDTVLVKFITQPEDAASRSDVADLTYGGVKTVDGAECHALEVRGEPTVVLRSEDEKAEGWERWFIEVGTKLPFRVERLLTVRHEDGEEESHLAVISRIRVNEPLPDNVFTLGKPAAPLAPPAPVAPVVPPAPAPSGDKQSSPPAGSGGGKPDGSAPAPSAPPAPPPPDAFAAAEPRPSQPSPQKGKGKKKGESQGGEPKVSDSEQAGDAGKGDAAGPGDQDEKSAAEKAKKEARKEARIDEGDDAPDFELKDAEGNSHRLSQYRGQAVLLDFWKSGCSACSDASPMLNAFHEEYKARGLVILGVNCFDKGEPIAYIKEQKLVFPQLLDGTAVAKQYKVGGQPTFILIGPDGKILARNSGHFDGMDEPMAKRIEKALKLIGKK